MRLQALSGDVFYLPDSTNVGVVAQDGAALVIDTAAERPFIETPLLEPFVLYGGMPPRNLRNKFLMAAPSAVAGVVAPGPAVLGGVAVEVVDLGGHSLGHIGAAVGDVLFAGDAFIGSAVLERHGVPFLVDVGRAEAALRRIEAGPWRTCLPSHGEPAPPRGGAVAENLARIAAVCERLRAALDEPRTVSDAAAIVWRGFGVHVAAPGEHYLMTAAIKSYLTHLVDAGEAVGFVEDERLLYRRRR
jgi:glyoxylase-like metal-dependent hydrolase (beta-lactamase superfamily II)